MNKPFVLAGLLAATFAARAHADLITVSVDGGYTTVTMADLNDRADKAKKSLEALGSKVSTTPLSSGLYVAAEAGLGLMPFMDLGPRIEFLQTGQSEFNTESGSVKTSTKSDATLTSFMLGANIGMDLPLTGLGFSAGAFGGYGYAVGKTSTTVNGSSPAGTLTAGGAFVGELEAKLKYSFLPLVSLYALGGIRMANIGQLKDGPFTTAAAYDFSGFNAGGGLSVGF